MSDAVNSPSHYRRGGVELADVIDAFDLGRWETQAAQYLFRARHKNDGADEAQDLKKAIWFLQRSLSELEPPATKANQLETADAVRRFGDIPVVSFAAVAQNLPFAAPQGTIDLAGEALGELFSFPSGRRTLRDAIELLAARGADPALLHMLVDVGWKLMARKDVTP